MTPLIFGSILGAWLRFPLCSCTWQQKFMHLMFQIQSSEQKMRETNYEDTLWDGEACGARVCNTICQCQCVTRDLAWVTLAWVLCNVEWQFQEWKRRAPDPRHEAIDPGLVEVPLRHIIIRGLFLATIGSRWICLSLSNTSYQRTVANNLIFNDPLNHLSKRRPWCRDNGIKLWDNAEL